MGDAGDVGAIDAGTFAPDDTVCAGNTLIRNRDTAIWDFRSNMQLPGLISDDTAYLDGDGVLD